ncbi:universal stress protein [Sporichthya brevicatena]|uniref:Universal stress protein n=1 Tax=Sporichthya brevicatena TaxID=171442 RepID=A0ABN1H6S9_9ACTN
MTLSTSPRVVVGYDGTPTARAALAVAAREAARRGRTLLIVHAEDEGWDLVRNGEQGLDPLAEAVELVGTTLPRGRVTVLDRLGPAATVLCEQAENAELLVVGRGNVGLLAVLMGSVAIDVASNASCPVLVVGDGGSAAPETGPVVAGVDRHHAEEVLEAAFREAELRGAPLLVVHSWSSLHWLGPDGLVTFDADSELLREQHLDWLHDLVDRYAGKHPDVEVTQAPREGRAADVLLSASGGAGLMIVGTRGRGPVRGMLLGSVGQKLVRHARCPVLVVRGDDPERTT